VLESAALRFSFGPSPADFGQHADITLQDTLHRDYVLRLFIDNQELGLQTQDNRAWTPAQRPYVPHFPTTHSPMAVRV